MDVTLISRYFDTRTAGVGSYSKLNFESLLKNENLKVNTLSLEDSVFSGYNSFSYLFFSLIGKNYLLKKDKFKNSDVFHAMTPMESFYIPKRKSVTSILDFIPFFEKDYSFYSSILAKLYNKSIKESIKSERLIVINSDLIQTLKNNYNVDESKVEVISPPISNNFYPKKEKHDIYTIGTLSSLSTRKRVDILIKAFLNADVENSKLLIGGRGPNYGELKDLAKNDNRIKFLGFIPDNEINDFYNSLDVFVFPTAIEGYGMPMVEAMGCGKPVISLEDSKIPSVIKNKTFVINKMDLSYVLENQSYKCDLKRNMQFFNEHSLDKIGYKLIKVYESI